MQLQLYLHFPFCKTKCFYCDFCSFSTKESMVQNYLDALQKEIRMVAKMHSDAEVSTVFIGGGTPSLMSEKQLRNLCICIHQHFDLQKDAEWTIEANPGTVEGAWLQTARACGINRLSMGVQAMQDSLLASIGRIHKREEAIQSIRLAKEAGFENLNVDLMFGLPDQTMAQYLQSIDQVASLGVTHLSAYALIVEEGTRLYDQVHTGSVRLPDEDLVADMQLSGIQRLKDHGYSQYEISNFAKDHNVCRHNVGYWQGEWYAGLGLSAHGMIPKQDGGILRTENHQDLETYLHDLQNEQLPRLAKTSISKEDAMFESIMLGLRMIDGVDEIRFQKRFGCKMSAVYGDVMDKLVATHLAYRDEHHHRFALTQRGLMIQNQVLLQFMDKESLAF